MNPICEKLPWDSRIFGFGIARVKGNRLKEADMAGITDWCSQKAVTCLCVLADIGDAETLEVLERHGFGLKDVRVTLVRAPEPQGSTNTFCGQLDKESLVRDARTEDISALEKVTENSYTDSRFYFDTRFPREKADAMYRAWIRKSCRGYADRVLVLERRAQVVGFITCHLQEGHGSIGLLGVSASQRGQRAGEQLVKSALSWFQERTVAGVSVVTQGRNVRAQRLYECLGFVTQSLQLWYHKWFIEDPK